MTTSTAIVKSITKLRPSGCSIYSPSSVFHSSSSAISSPAEPPSASSFQSPEKENRSRFSKWLLFLPGAITFGLGTWQIFRRQEKVKMLEYRQDRLGMEPLNCNSLFQPSEELDSLEFRKVTCRGGFDENKSIYVGPRSRSISGVTENGYYVITPLLPIPNDPDRGKDGHLTGEISAPETTDPTFRAWKTDDHLVMSWLINSMTTEVGENFLLFRTAKEIWEAARETYSSTENSSELFEIETRLYDLRQGELSVTQYFNTLTRCWLQLDMFEIYPWKCPDDSALYRKIVEQKRTIRFLLGLNKDLDEVRGRIMGIKPLPTIREAFAEVRREESRKKLMMTDNHATPTVEGSALYTHNSSQNNTPRKGRPWCDHCRKPGHVKENCWKIYGKPADWKPSSRRNDRENRAHAAATTDNNAEFSPFTKEQIEALQKLIGQVSSSGHAPQSPAEQPTSFLAHQGSGFGEGDWQC